MSSEDITEARKRKMSFYLFEMKAEVECECIVKRLEYKIESLIYIYIFILRCIISLQGS